MERRRLVAKYLNFIKNKFMVIWKMATSRRRAATERNF